MEAKKQSKWFQPVAAADGLSWANYTWLILASGLLGLITSALVWLFNKGFNSIHDLLFGDLASALGGWVIVLIPAVGGLLVSLLLHYFTRPEKFAAMAHIIDGVAEQGGKLDNRNGLVYIIASMLGIGFGAPVGADTPSAMIGAHLASFFGGSTRQKEVFTRALIISGVAAGISATFDAQFAAIFFGLEVVLGGIGGIVFVVPTLVAVGIAAMFRFLTSGMPTIYEVSPVLVRWHGRLFWYLLVAVVAAFAGILYVKLLPWMKAAWGKAKLPFWAKATLAGLLVGIVGLWIPDIFGTGLSQMQQYFSGAQVAIGTLLIFAAAKLLLTPSSLGAGFAGGVIGPALAIGSALGLALGEFLAYIDPGLGILPVAFSMVAAASILAAVFQAPLFGAMMILEMTADYAFMVPIMVCAALSYAIARAFLSGSAYTFALYGAGIELKPGIYAIFKRREEKKS